MDRYSLISDYNVELVYVAFPNNKHYEVMLKRIEYSKKVLYEKPITANVKKQRI